VSEQHRVVWQTGNTDPRHTFHRTSDWVGRLVECMVMYLKQAADLRIWSDMLMLRCAYLIHC